MARYYLETYGCTANRGESHEIERRLRDAGHYRVPMVSDADVSILNTCTVVETTDDRMVRRIEALGKETADLVVTGCMALAQGTRIEKLTENVQVCSWDEVPTAVGNGECPTQTPDSEPILDHVIGILPIARGCMSNCSYCITKHATGKINSPSIEENVRKAQNLLDAGAKEIRVTGQDTGVYGWDKGKRQLAELLDEICALPGEFRVRVGMANPKGVHGIRDNLVETFRENDELYNFLHIPVQSGSDAVLGAMRRQHQVHEFMDTIETFNNHLEYWTLATDFITGFPTETQTDHEQSKALLRETRPERINITRFSKRPGTDAATMKGLGGTVKKQRSSELTDLKMQVVGDAYESMVGTEHEILIVEPGTGKSMKGYDEAYRQVIVQDAVERGIEPGDFLPVTITNHETVYAFGEPA